MDICMIGHKDFPSRLGGIEVVVQELAVRMAAAGHRVTMYNRVNEDGETASLTEYRGVAIRHTKTVPVPGFNAMLGSFASTFQALKQGHEVVHFHAEGPSMATMVTRLRKVPSVVTIHGLDWQRKKWGRLGSTYIHLAEKVLARCADEIIVLSPDVRQYFLDTYGRETHLINNGIAPRAYCPPQLIREKWGLETDSYVLYLGRLTPEKGVDYLIRAFRQIATDRKLVIAGTGDDANYNRLLHELADPDDRILFAGFVTGQLHSELYDNCAVYCLPSEIEGMPLSLLEGLSAGAVCLTSDIPENTGVAPAFTHTFRSKDTDSLRAALEPLLALPRDPEHRRAQQNFILEKYSWDDVTERTLAVYEAAAARHRSS